MYAQLQYNTCTHTYTYTQSSPHSYIVELICCTQVSWSRSHDHAKIARLLAEVWDPTAISSWQMMDVGVDQ
jgi:hypothetical protein